MSTDNTELTFIIGEEFVPVIETSDKFEKSLFKDVYKKVYKDIDDFLVSGKDEQSDLDDSSQKVNNIFAFVGDRGSGKTSCMLSVVQAMSANKLPKGYELYSEIKKSQFVKMEMIDPSFFEETNNILQLFIGKLFNEFKKIVEDRNFNRDKKSEFDYNKRTLISAFEEIQKNITVLFNKNKPSTDSLDGLLEHSASYELRSNIKKVVELFLKMCGDPDKKKKVLILPIDDIDLQTQHAFAMVEQIRKYLMHPNLVILMALKIDQLEDIATRQYVSEFSDVLNKKYMSYEAPVEMSERYVAKLIPLDRRYYLPDMEANFLSSIKIYTSKESYEKHENAIQGNLSEYNDYLYFESVRTSVLSFLNFKTGFVFYNTNTFTSFIVSRNLRELRSMIKLLHGMQNSADLKHNKWVFKKYFFETWIINNLNHKDAEMIKYLWETENCYKNKVAVELLNKKFLKHEVVFCDYSAVDEIIKASNKSYDVSAGDVLGLIDFLSKHNVDRENQKLFFAIKTIYSFVMNELYVVDRSLIPERIFVKSSLLNKESEYRKFISGQFINLDFYDIMAPEINNVSRLAREINIEEIINCISELKQSAMENIVDGKFIDIENYQGISDDQKDKLVSKLRIVEFFILNIISLGVRKKVNLRSLSNPSYIFKLHRLTRNVNFNAMGFLFNLTDLDGAYKKYDVYFNGEMEGRRMVDYVSVQSQSLYKLYNSMLKEKKYNCFFDSAEVISFLLEYCLQHRIEGSTNDLYTYEQFYLMLYKFDLLLKSDHDLRFELAAPLSRALKSRDSELKLIFLKTMKLNYDLNTMLRLLDKKNKNLPKILQEKWLEIFRKHFKDDEIYNSLDAFERLNKIKSEFDAISREKDSGKGFKLNIDIYS